jgi:RES domain-containing protein
MKTPKHIEAQPALNPPSTMMETKPHPNYSRILGAVKPLAAHARHLSGVWYRCVETSFAHEIISGEGARVHGARWNPVGSFRTVYLSDTPETPLEEYLARARRMKWPDHKSLPMVMAGVEVNVRRILDLRVPGVAAVIAPLLKTERQHWRSIQSRREAMPQAIGRAAMESGLQGLLTTSQQVKGGLTLVLFPDKLGRHDQLSAPKLKMMG